jgi:hypothetical protein
LLRDGDYSVIADVDEVVDALAIELAELKGRTGAKF